MDERGDEAIEVSNEISGRFPGEPIEDASLYVTALVHFEKKQFSAALARLYRILERKRMDSDSYVDDAYYLIGRIYAEPGENYSPLRAYRAYLAFVREEKQAAFRDSIWRPDALKRLSAIQGFSVLEYR